VDSNTYLRKHYTNYDSLHLGTHTPSRILLHEYDRAHLTKGSHDLLFFCFFFSYTFPSPFTFSPAPWYTLPPPHFSLFLTRHPIAMDFAFPFMLGLLFCRGLSFYFMVVWHHSFWKLHTKRLMKVLNQPTRYLEIKLYHLKTSRAKATSSRPIFNRGSSFRKLRSLHKFWSYSMGSWRIQTLWFEKVIQASRLMGKVCLHLLWDNNERSTTIWLKTLNLYTYTHTHIYKLKLITKEFALSSWTSCLIKQWVFTSKGENFDLVNVLVSLVS
jgi:hypothetical protein